MSENKYDYYIVSEELHRPIGGTYKYAAKVGGIVRVIGPSKTERVQHAFGEFWGETKQEAEKKARDAVEAWIADH